MYGSLSDYGPKIKAFWSQCVLLNLKKKKIIHDNHVNLKVSIKTCFLSGELDLVLTPGLAFTMNGDRLGRGKGYYDKFFEKCKNQLKSFPYLIGLAYNEQIVSDIPTTENDVRLDLVLSAGTL